MTTETSFSLRIGPLAAGALLLLGCPNPNTYTTPRTVGSGNISHSIAAEAWGFSIPTSAANSSNETLSATFPTFPTYTLRIGIGDSAEIGVRVANMSSLGSDFKLNFLRSSVLDLAIDPAFQVFELSVSDNNGTDSSLRIAYLHLPLLIGLNLSRTVTLVLAPGVTWGFASGSTTSSDSGTDQASATIGALGRLGIGADFRLRPGFALHPEVTVLRTFHSDATALYMFGLGFNFGAMPSYDDVGGEPPAEPPPPYAPPYQAPPPPGAAPPPPNYSTPPGG
jgi:hypothetical protein